MSLLDNEDVLMQETNVFNKNFPSFSNCHESNNHGYYAFYNKYFLPADDEGNKRCVIIDYSERFHNYRSNGYEISIFIGVKDKYYWYSLPYDYVFNSELEEFEEDLQYGSYTAHKLIAFKDKGKTKIQARTKAYKILEELKNNPSKLYDLMKMNENIPRIKYNLFRLKNL